MPKHPGKLLSLAVDEMVTIVDPGAVLRGLDPDRKHRRNKFWVVYEDGSEPVFTRDGVLAVKLTKRAACA